MLNAKTGVELLSRTSPLIDTKTHKLTDRQPEAFKPTVDPNPPRPPTPSDSNRTVAEGTIQQKGLFPGHFSATACHAKGCFEPIGLNGFVLVGIVDRFLAERALTYLPCYCFCLKLSDIYFFSFCFVRRQ